MYKQLIDRKDLGRMIVLMSGSVIGISNTSYTISSQSGSWKLGKYRERMKISSNNKLEDQMNGSHEIHKVKTTTGFAIEFYERDGIRCLIF